ncbi:MAG TPA: hypothetical protein VIW45_14880 [Vicinamibacterales bacterium]|jgi:hypothetical protein
MDSIDARYYSIQFDDVSGAVQYCGELVPHLVARLRTSGEPGERPAIWFHMRPAGNGGTAKCELLMTPSAILAAISAQLRAPRIDSESRMALPSGSVLVLGEDDRPTTTGAQRRRVLPMRLPSELNQQSA